MQSVTAQPYSRRPVETELKKLAAWLGIEFMNVQRSVARASARTVTSATTATTNDGLILVDTTGGAVTVTLPDPTTCENTQLVIKRISGGGNNVTIGGTVDGTISPTLTVQWASMMVWSNGTGWFKVAAI